MPDALASWRALRLNLGEPRDTYHHACRDRGELILTEGRVSSIPTLPKAGNASGVRRRSSRRGNLCCSGVRSRKRGPSRIRPETRSWPRTRKVGGVSALLAAAILRGGGHPPRPRWRGWREPPTTCGAGPLGPMSGVPT